MTGLILHLKLFLNGATINSTLPKILFDPYIQSIAPFAAMLRTDNRYGFFEILLLG